MTETTRHHSHKKYLFHGPNATLIDWLDASPLAQKALEKAGIEAPTLYRALSNHNPEAQSQSGKEAIKRLWHAYPELGPYPFLETLSDYEFSGKFYSNYREHVLHQLRGYWLGLYLFDTCHPIREAALRETGKDDEAAATDAFLRRWCACAVYHDIGYILENEEGNNPAGTAWQETCRILSETLYSPLSTLPRFAADGLNQTVEKSVVYEEKIWRPEINSLKKAEEHDKQDLLAQIVDYGIKAGLGPGSPFRTYYDYAFKHSPASRPRFRDHGVVSALLLMKVWFDFRDYVEKLSQKNDNPLLQSCLDDIKNLEKALAAHEPDVLCAAGAMALHNITPSLWTPTTRHEQNAIDSGLTFHQYRIRLTDAGLKPPLGATPLAFLLALTDTLQTWDRPRFRAIREDDTPGLSDQDMDLWVEKDKIHLWFKDDEEFRYPESNPKSLFTKTVNNLKEYLEQQAIDDLLVCREPTPVEAPPTPERGPIVTPEPPPIPTPTPSTAPPKPPKPVSTDRYRLSIVSREHPNHAYLLFTTDALSFGGPTDKDADIQIRAAGMKPGHCRLEQAAGAYTLVKGAGICALNDNIVDNKATLSLNVTLRIGKTFEMKVAAISATALTLTMDYSDPVDETIRGIVMATGDLRIGPDPEDHIQVPYLPAPIRLFRENDGFVTESDGEIIAIIPGTTVAVGDVRLFLSPE
jgi:hypothetical protein